MRYEVSVRVIVDYHYVIEADSEEDVSDIATEMIEESDNTLVDSYIDDVEISSQYVNNKCDFVLEKKGEEYLIKDYETRNLIKRI